MSNEKTTKDLPGKISYIIGDATNPIGKGHNLIVHICNNVGAWGAGFVLALSKKWPHPEKIYRDVKKGQLKLGMVQIIQVEPTTWVANIVAQNGIDKEASSRLVSYDALAVGLYNVRLFLAKAKSKDNLDITVHMPRVGCGLGGGKWECIEGIIRGELRNRHIFVYDLSKKDATKYYSSQILCVTCEYTPCRCISIDLLKTMTSGDPITLKK